MSTILPDELPETIIEIDPSDVEVPYSPLPPTLFKHNVYVETFDKKTYIGLYSGMRATLIDAGYHKLFVTIGTTEINFDAIKFAREV